jgi:hypothetical protein
MLPSATEFRTAASEYSRVHLWPWLCMPIQNMPELVVHGNMRSLERVMIPKITNLLPNLANAVLFNL